MAIFVETGKRRQATIKELGAEGVTVLVQGKLVAGRIEEAGIAAQPKAPRQ